MKTFLKVIGYIGLIYLAIFFAWMALVLGCMETNTAKECRDNDFSRVAFKIYPVETIQGF